MIPDFTDSTKTYLYIKTTLCSLKKEITKYIDKFLTKILDSNYAMYGGLPKIALYQGEYIKSSLSLDPIKELTKVVELQDKNLEDYEKLNLIKLKGKEDLKEVNSALTTIALNTESLAEFLTNIPERLDLLGIKRYRTLPFNANNQFKPEIEKVNEIYDYWLVLNKLLESNS